MKLHRLVLGRMLSSGRSRATSLDLQARRLVASMKDVKRGENQYLDRLRDHFVPSGGALLPGIEEEIKETMASSLGQAGLLLDYEYLKFQTMKKSFKDSPGAEVTCAELEAQIDKINRAKTLLRIQRESMGIRKGQTINAIYPNPVLEEEQLEHKALEAVARVTAWQAKGLLLVSKDFDLLRYLESNGMVETLKRVYDAPLAVDNVEYEYSQFHTPRPAVQVREKVALHVLRVLQGDGFGAAGESDAEYSPALEAWVEELLTRLCERQPEEPLQASVDFAQGQLQQARVGWKRELGSRLKPCLVICAEGDPSKRIGRGPVVSDEGRENLFRFGQTLRKDQGICFPEEVFARTGRNEWSLQSTEAVLHGA